MFLHHFLEKSAKDYPEKIAVVHDQERLAYQQLNLRANNIAVYLQTNGVVKGDRVALLLENNTDYIAAYYAILKIGAVAVPLNPGLKPDGLKYMLEDLNPSGLITNFKSERLLKATPILADILKLLIIRRPKQNWRDSPFTVRPLEEIDTREPETPKEEKILPEDLASIIYTSGSTGAAKGVMLSHNNIVSNTLSICDYLKLTHTDIQMVVLPFFYVMGKSLLNTHMAVGGTLVLNNRFLYPADVIHQMVQESVTGFAGVPSTYAYLLNRSPLAANREKLSALRYCSQAGGHMALALKESLRKTLPKHTQLFIMYGATEASARLTYLSPEEFENKKESIGKPIKDVIIRILNENGDEVPDGSEGELVASGPNIMKGYWRSPEETAQVLSGKGYHTGDIGYRDADGFLFIKNRKDGLIKVGGHRINPTEIEDLLLATGAVLEVAVVGIPDKLMGNRLDALVVANHDDCTKNFLMETCAKGLPKHKWPSNVYFFKMLPKNANGKIDRQKCCEMVLNT